jgi:hypothetical protein
MSSLVVVGIGHFIGRYATVPSAGGEQSLHLQFAKPSRFPLQKILDEKRLIVAELHRRLQQQNQGVNIKSWSTSAGKGRSWRS